MAEVLDLDAVAMQHDRWCTCANPSQPASWKCAIALLIAEARLLRDVVVNMAIEAKMNEIRADRAVTAIRRVEAFAAEFVGTGAPIAWGIRRALQGDDE